MPSTKFVHSASEYAASLRKLFPLGAYWDEQFADLDSDLSRWLIAKTDELIRFRERFAMLIAESSPRTTEAMIESWERVLLATAHPQLPLESRRAQLATSRLGFVTRKILDSIAELYGASIIRLYYPFRPAFFGHTRIARVRMSSPAAYSVLFIEARIADMSRKADFESAINEAALAHYSIYVIYP